MRERGSGESKLVGRARSTSCVTVGAAIFLGTTALSGGVGCATDAAGSRCSSTSPATADRGRHEEHGRVAAEVGHAAEHDRSARDRDVDERGDRAGDGAAVAGGCA